MVFSVFLMNIAKRGECGEGGEEDVPPSAREGDHEVVEGESATIKFVLTMGITLSIHSRLVFRYVQTFFFRRLLQSAPLTAPSRREPPSQSPSVTAPPEWEPKLDPRFAVVFLGMMV